MLACLTLASAATPALAATEISAVQVGLSDELTRVVVSLSDQSRYQIREQQETDRLVLAFPDSRLRGDHGRSGQGWGLVRDFQIEAAEDGGERVVLSLKRPVSVRSVSSAEGAGVDRHALIIDLVARPPGEEEASGTSTRGPMATQVRGNTRLAALPPSGGARDSAAPVASQELRLSRLEQLLEAQERLLQQQQAQLDLQRAELQALRSRQAVDTKSGSSASERRQRYASAEPPTRLAQAQPAPVAPRSVAPRPVAPRSTESDATAPVSPSPVAPRPAAVPQSSSAPVAPRPVPPQTGTGGPVAPQPVAPTTPQPTTPQPTTTPPGEALENARERPKSEKKTDELLLAQNGILLPPGQAQLELGTTHSHFSSNRINIGGFTIFEAIVIGTIRVDQLDRDVVTSTATARVGLLPRLQVEARLPYIYRRDDELLSAGTNDQRNVVVDGNGLGDVEGTVTWQPIQARGILPDTLARLRVKSRSGRDSFEIPTQSVGSGGQTRLVEAPTGSGFITVNPGLTAVWRSDPVAFFLSGGYAYNKARKVGAFGKIDPGDTIDFSTGFNVSLSDRVSMNMTFVNQFTGKTRQNGIETEGSDTNDARVQVGASIGLTPSFSLVASAGIGLTEESPDYTFGLSGSYSFDFGTLFSSKP